MNNSLRPLSAGYQLDSYAIVRKLGGGGFGLTYVAEDRVLQRPVVIKEYALRGHCRRGENLRVEPRDAPCREQFDWWLAKFVEEARTLAALPRHPNIAEVFGFIEANGTAYMVLAYEAGRTLRDWLADLGRHPTQAELDAIMGGLLDALETMHAASVVHRDIAPDNVIMRPDGTPVVVDFGAARHLVPASGIDPRQLYTRFAIGKVPFAPPEQWSADVRERGPWTDIYGLGATLYVAITGTLPPDPATGGAAPPLALRADLAGHYRPAFLAAIDRAMHPDRRQRQQSAAALRADAFAGRTADVHVAPEGEAAVPLAAADVPLVTFEQLADQRPPPPAPRARRWMRPAMVGAALGALAATALASVPSNFGRAPTGQSWSAGTGSAGTAPGSIAIVEQPTPPRSPPLEVPAPRRVADAEPVLLEPPTEISRAAPPQSPPMEVPAPRPLPQMKAVRHHMLIPTASRSMRRPSYVACQRSCRVVDSCVAVRYHRQTEMCDLSSAFEAKEGEPGRGVAFAVKRPAARATERGLLGGWTSRPDSLEVQVGYYPTVAQAEERIAVLQAMTGYRWLLNAAVYEHRDGAKISWRARFVGFDRERADDACSELTRAGVDCWIAKPNG